DHIRYRPDLLLAVAVIELEDDRVPLAAIGAPTLLQQIEESPSNFAALRLVLRARSLNVGVRVRPIVAAAQLPVARFTGDVQPAPFFIFERETRLLFD